MATLPTSTTEKVTHTYSTEFKLHIPEIVDPSRTGNNGLLLKEDIARVLDYSNLGVDPPKPALLKIMISELKFHPCQCYLRGGYFLFENESGRKKGLPVMACAPLFQTTVEFPLGGRRVFREHAVTDASKGYEFVIGRPSSDVKLYVVAETMTMREEWAVAIRLRAEIRNRDTELRPLSLFQDINTGALPPQRTSKKNGGMSYRMPGNKSGRMSMSILGASEADLEKESVLCARALGIFGENKFSELDYMNMFYIHKNECDDAKERNKLEDYLGSVKAGLKDMVLEQYKYFVEASREMTIMGNDIKHLKNLVESHVTSLDTMRDIDFREAFERDESDEEDDSDASDDDWNAGQDEEDVDDDSSIGSASASTEESPSIKHNHVNESPKPITIPEQQQLPPSNTGRGTPTYPTLLEVPPWLADATEEISVYIYQSRYTESTDLICRAQSEIQDLLHQNDKLSPTHRFLSAKQLTTLQCTLHSTHTLSSVMATRLAESLRRKNEALRQCFKRERHDPLTKYEPLLSPVCLNDDATSLSLLVKLGQTQEAAIAYSTRRSLLLAEALNERPLGGEGKNDICIYASQISQGFFSSLAMSVEGFLDLFIGVKSNVAEEELDTMSFLGGVGRTTVPPGAMSSMVFWCDLELSKFATIFCGPKVLGCLNLTLPKIMSEDVHGILREGEVEGEAEDQCGAEGVGRNYFLNKERQGTIELAAMCIDQVFSLASENLDSIGLPLSSRLADYIRGRLKGCEEEIAKCLKGKWDHVIYDWYNSSTSGHPEEQSIKFRRGGDLRQMGTSFEEGD